MPSLRIRNLPDETYTVLRRRATQEGKRLQQYLLAELNRLAAHPTILDLGVTTLAKIGCFRPMLDRQITIRLPKLHLLPNPNGPGPLRLLGR